MLLLWTSIWKRLSDLLAIAKPSLRHGRKSDLTLQWRRIRALRDLSPGTESLPNLRFKTIVADAM